MGERAFGWLVVNRFLGTDKFRDIAARLVSAAEAHGARIALKYNDELLPALCGGACGAFDMLPGEKPDFVLFYDKDIRLAAELEQRGMRLFNSSRAIELCDDKALTHAALKGAVPMPLTYSAPFTYENVGYTELSFAERFAEALGFPLVIKEVCGSFGQQVYLAHSMEEVGRILRSVGGRRVIFQRFIKESAGRDLRLNVVGGKVIAAMERTSGSGDFRANITIGGSMRKHTPTPAEEAIAIRAAELLGLDFCGADLIGSENGPLLIEVNSNAHFKSIYDCTGVNAADEIIAHILRSIGA
ncbi:MAG: RimK family alpha-L-glutamate ligase [Clostridia bacterium]|nr:RimK family alpha-L-glutamate ligase [Clostridia bacterium]